jgi:hypothetical protein
MLTRIAKDAGLSRQTVYRIKSDPAACEAALERGGCSAQTLPSGEILTP